MGLKIAVESNLSEAKAQLKTYPPRLNAAMYEASDTGTHIIASQLERTTVARTGMSPEMVHSMVEVEFGPYPGLVARGEVGFSRPPAFFYPKKSKALHFTINGRGIFAKRVRGSRPYPLVGRAVFSAESEVERNFRRGIQEVLLR
jgi:hypothetical protein